MRKGFIIFFVSVFYAATFLTSSFVFAQTTTLTSSPFTIASPSFSSSQAIPKTFTCDDKNISPELSWSGTPENTKTFMLIVSDPDAPGGIHYHWVLYNIPPNVTSLSEGIATPPGTQGKNSAGTARYEGPCPPKGSTHSYIFTLYALDSSLNIPDDSAPEAVIKAALPHILGITQVTSSFGH